MKRIVVVAALIVFLMSACNGSTSSDVISADPIDSSTSGLTSEPEDEYPPQPPPTVASPPPRRPQPPGQLDAVRYAEGNTANRGIVTEDEENIYFANHLDRSAIYVFNRHTQEVRKLEGTYHASRLHLRGEYIYYTTSNWEAGIYTYRIRTDGGGRERAFEDQGDVLRFPQNENEPYFMHLFPERRQYLLNRQMGEKTFLFDGWLVIAATADSSGRMWFVDTDHIMNPLTEFRLFEHNVMHGDTEAKAIDVSARFPTRLQYLDGYVYYMDIGGGGDGTIYRLNTQTYEETVIVPINPKVEVRISADDTVRTFIVPGATRVAERVGFQNLLVTSDYIFASVFLRPFEDGVVSTTIIRICRDTLEFWKLYDTRDDIYDIYGPTLIGIADGKIFFSAGNYQYTKVMDFEGNRLDRQFGLINRDTPG